MMTPLDAHDLERLLAPRPGPCVSIYLPTHRTGREMQQDKIRLKNLLRKAEGELEAVAIRGSNAAGILKPARDLLPEEPFWENLSDGLAVFLAPGFKEIYRIPYPFEELSVVSGAFHVKRLLPLVSGDGRFYVLALSQNHVRLLRGTRFSVEELSTDGMPTSLREALGMGDPENVPPMHGGAGDMEKTDLRRYFRRVDEGLREHLANGKAPLVLAGVDHYFPLYREVSKYPSLADVGVAGSPEKVTPQELHERAWAIVEPTFRKAESDALARYRAQAGLGRTTDQLDLVLPAARHGRIDTLFVATGRQRWGAFLPGDAGSVIVHEHYEPGDRDLLDVAAAATIRAGGRVFPLAPDALPGQTDAAALLRY